MNNAELIVKVLKSAGIERGFGVPSGNVLPLMEAMRTGGIDFILTAHEGSAGFAADVTGRLTGKPGLCIATLGPGATNLATGVGCAFLDRSPMIAITCNLNTDQLGRRIQMYIDHHALFAPITKASVAIRPDAVVKTVKAAIELACTEPVGPVHLDLPEDVALAPATEDAEELDCDSESVPPPSDFALSHAGRMLSHAQRPIAVIGASAMRMHAPELLRRFVELHNMPFATTTMAKGMIDEDHPLSIGCIERARRQMQRSFLRGADLIVGLGYDTIEVEYEAWIGDTPLLNIDIDPVDVDDSVNVDGQVIGNIDVSLAGLLESAAPSAWTSEEISAHRDAFQSALRPAAKNFAPHHVIDTVRSVLPNEGLLAFDVGAHTHQIASQWTAHAPGTFLITNGWSSMGFGLPAAIAAKLARPELPVVCIVGDGCFQMTCGEVTVAKRQGLAIPFVILDDQWLSLIQVKQTRRQFKHYGTDLLPDAYDAPKHYFGVPAVTAKNQKALAKAVQAALNADGPTVIEAQVDASHYMETVFD